MYTYNYNGDYSLGPRAFYYWCCCCWWLRRKPWNFFTLGTSRGTCSLSFSLSCTHAHSTENERTIVEKTWNVIRFSVTRFALLLNLLYIYFINTHNFLHSVAQWNFTSSRANLFACICTFHYTALLYVCMYEYAYAYICVCVHMHTICCCCPLGCCYIFLFLLNKQLRCPKRR